MGGVLSHEDGDYIVARHEAGHAVASYLLRGYIGKVTIDPPDDQHAGGAEVWVLEPPLVDDHGRIVVPSPLTPGDESCFEDVVKIAQAGPVAEAILWGRDYDDVLSRNKSDEATVVSVTRRVWPDRAHEKELELRNEIQEFLERERRAVEALGDVLENERIVGGERAAEVIGNARARH